MLNNRQLNMTQNLEKMQECVFSKYLFLLFELINNDIALSLNLFPKFHCNINSLKTCGSSHIINFPEFYKILEKRNN